MEFVRKNIVFVVTMSIALIIFLLLVFMVISKHSEVKRSFNEVEHIKNEIKKLIKQKPAPVDENLKKIQADINILSGKLQAVHQIFGHPYLVAVDGFAKTLGLKNADELKEKFTSFWNKNSKKKDVTANGILKDFLKDFDSKKLPQAYNFFQTEAQKQTVEKIDGNNVNDFLLAALGYPRQLGESPVRCKTYMAMMQESIRKLLNSENSRVTLDSAASRFSFGDYESRMPLAADIPVIIKHWQIIEDIISRVMSSGITKLTSINKVNGLHGARRRGYVFFRYSLTLEGNLEAIRKFVNNLESAYKDNRTYIIRNITFEKIIDDARGISEKESSATSRRPLGIVGIGEEEDKSKETAVSEEEIPVNKRPGYGFKLIGRSKLCKSLIEFDYVIYEEDELKPLR